jgi:hypothetical protein
MDHDHTFTKRSYWQWKSSDAELGSGRPEHTVETTYTTFSQSDLDVASDGWIEPDNELLKRYDDDICQSFCSCKR